MERGSSLQVAIEDSDHESSLRSGLADHELCSVTASVSDADLVVAGGSQGVRSSVAADPSVPIFPVGLEAEWSPAVDATATVVELLAQLATTGLSEIPTTSHRQLTISVGDRGVDDEHMHAVDTESERSVDADTLESERSVDADNQRAVDTADQPTATAVCDCSVITSEPARISEYAVSTDEAPLATFRADGVVAATPLGSTGYSRAAGGPRLAPQTGLAVVPIAPFAMQADRWVVAGSLSITVKRETSVAVYADERPVVAETTADVVYLRPTTAFTVIDWRWLRTQQEKLETL